MLDLGITGLFILPLLTASFLRILGRSSRLHNLKINMKFSVNRVSKDLKAMKDCKEIKEMME